MDEENKIIKDFNEIKQVTVSDLLDGRYFYIPTYQRGYRWSKQQVIDLCNDLLEYALKKGKHKDSFYSLQPLIVVKDKKEIDGEEKECYIVIDGQQRLTTIFLLYRFLAKESNFASLQYVKKKRNKDLYHIFYETRKEDFPILESLVFTPLEDKDIRDIDIAHISNALIYMKEWLEGDKEGRSAKYLYDLFKKTDQFSQWDVTEKMLNLLNNKKGTDKEEGNVQFIWYELDKSKDHIKEFLKENKGKIPLTNTEKIKALLLQRRNFGKISEVENDTNSSKQYLDRRQNAMAKDWDHIEMNLHEPDFWAMISDNKARENDRIEIIFHHLYELSPNKDKYKDVDDYLFRFFYDWLESLNNEQTEKNAGKDPVDVIWDAVMDTYRMLRNWYFNPLIYNLIGLLSKCKVQLLEIRNLFFRPDIVDTETFIIELKKLISEKLLNEIPISTEGNIELDFEKGKEFIDLHYGTDNLKIRNLFIFNNVITLVNQIESVIEETSDYNKNKKASDAARSPRDINSVLYRFPFDILDSMGWDIEHIDSYTTNDLEKEKDQEIFIKEAQKIDYLNDHPDFKLQKENYDKASQDKKEEQRKELIKTIRTLLDEDNSEAKKNWIGNLTLLDSGTNRSYKNKIYPLKQQILRDRIKKGVFVPIITSNVFEKRIEGYSPDSLYWNFTDKKAYHDMMLKEIKEFIQLYPPTLKN